jgi:hypothetical protein
MSAPAGFMSATGQNWRRKTTIMAAGALPPLEGTRSTGPATPSLFRAFFWVRPLPIAILAAGIALAGSAAPAGAALFSAKGAVIAILGSELFVGEAEGHLSGDGTLDIHSQKNPGLTCAGQFTSSAEEGGKGQLRCSDGSVSTFKFKRLSVRRGYGGGSFTRGSMSFAYGLTAEEARPYLKLPKGKKLEQTGKELALVDL